MPKNLTGSKINETYAQLLHVDGGVSSVSKTVSSGTGTDTALKISTSAISVGNVSLSGSGITPVSGTFLITDAIISGGSISDITELAIADGGTGASTASGARTNLGLGTISTQNSNNVTITGGAISGVSFSGSFSGMTLVEATTLATSNVAAGCNLNGSTLSADGTDTNIDINITPKGSGEVNVTNIDVLSGKVPFNTITNRAYASFYDAGTTDQTGSTTDRTAVKWATASVTGAGITVASNSRITLAAAGTYRFNVSVQVANSDNSDHDITFWFAKNGTNIPSSSSVITVPKNTDGGKSLFAIEIFETVTATDYVELYWYPENAALTLQYVAPVAANPGVTPAIPAIPPAIVVVERVA